MKSLTNMVFLVILSLLLGFTAMGQDYKIIDTGQELCYDTLVVISCPQPGDPFYGQDSQNDGIQFSFQDNSNGTVTDLNTGLTWQSFLFEDKFSYEDALAIADTLSLAGFNDWRLPSIKELYSLIDFRGITGMSASESIPFIDTSYFEFRYGDETSGERFIDAQYISSTEYTGTTMNGNFTVFGLNLADGRIKGYPTEMIGGFEKLFEVRMVRGNTLYGINNFSHNSDGTITDASTDLMWTKEDNGEGLNWQEALNYVYQRNQENYLGYNDWRLPNAKELQSIVDYSRSPQFTNSAAIDSIFTVSEISDEGGGLNYPFYWTGTTHSDGPPQNQDIKAVYIAFGEALGFMEIPPGSGNYILMDVHGAGAQRSDPKQGDPNNFPHGFGPQGDVIRIYNFVRLVRDAGTSEVNNEETSLPSEFKLEQNYPNPFNPTTIIKYEVPDQARNDNVLLKIYDILGNEIATLVDEYKPAGSYEVEFDAEGLTSGIYFYQLKVGNKFIQTKKMLFIK